ncbi:hypothetical protein H2O64_23675 [Kordia sp. YSTF-M3]|uniref:DUF4625 domain-containing protein n=1 Tax=Kordia aestuariivivens TaxID=2759037 RepID=A0ABR7QGY7_9FLAO|nr:hypothetical protein [Kordia aestuariivivens]MBC8757688.1 hypothetical protein [Kordia aestuariivivens]
MKLKHIYIALIACICFACESGTSQNKNYITDLTIDNNGLTCDGITMGNHTGNIKKSEFSYGEKITLYYKNMTGFVLQDSLAYPNMDIFVTNKKGDTVMSQKDLFKNIKEGYTEEDLNLRSNLTFAAPMIPNNSYQMHINVIDKNSDGYFNLKKDFTIIENPLLKTKADGLTYKILYLYSQTRDIAIVDDNISPNESVYILLEDLEGYAIDADGKVDLLASISLTEANGRVINENNNLFPEPVSAVDLKDQLYASLKVTEGQISNPVTCVFKVKDKKSGHTFETSVDLIVAKKK